MIGFRKGSATHILCINCFTYKSFSRLSVPDVVPDVVLLQSLYTKTTQSFDILDILLICFIVSDSLNSDFSFIHSSLRIARMAKIKNTSF